MIQERYNYAASDLTVSFAYMVYSAFIDVSYLYIINMRLLIHSTKTSSKSLTILNYAHSCLVGVSGDVCTA